MFRTQDFALSPSQQINLAFVIASLYSSVIKNIVNVFGQVMSKQYSPGAIVLELKAAVS